jgi:DNA-directed RNA polymerase subunit beta
MAKVNQRLSLAKQNLPQLEVNLLDAQRKSFQTFIDADFEALFKEINPIIDYGGGSSWELYFEDFSWEKPKQTFREAQILGLTFDAPVHANVKLVNKRTGEIKKQKIFVADVPLMGDRCSFMISGNERVVVLQIIRSEGLLFVEAKASKPNKRLYSVKLMPERGRWFEFEVNKYGVMSVKLLDKHPRILLTTLLRALGYSSTEEIQRLFESVDKGETSFLEATLRKDQTRNTEEALLDIYRKLRPEDSITVDNARAFLEAMFFDAQRFYLGKVGRYKLNKKLNIEEPITENDYTLKKRDIVEIIKGLIEINNGKRRPDDVDSLTNRRIRGVGELIAERVRVGVKRMEKNIKDRMSYFSTSEDIMPSNLINTRPVSAAINQLFGSSALSRYMDQQNPLSEIETKRRISAGGPRGLTKERATFSVRDVHNSHYSRICPIYTPEGPSVGMVLHQSVYSRLNDFGFLEAPYYKVISQFEVGKDKPEKFVGRVAGADVTDENGKVVAKQGEEITPALITKLEKAGVANFKVGAFISDEIVYLDADDELNHKIASRTLKTDENGNILEGATYVRDGKDYSKVDVSEIDLVDINPAQIASLALALLPFAAQDDTNRTMMGSRTQTQSVPLVKPQAPIVGTGFETIAAAATGRMVYAADDGVVLYADSERVLVEYKPAKEKAYKHEYYVEKFTRTNQSTSFSQRTAVRAGEEFKKGDVLVDAPCTTNGEIALGVNLRTAYFAYEGYNYEDAMVISERLIKEDILTSVHIQEYAQEIRETKLGDELITRDIPNVGEYSLRSLDEDGIVRIGAQVHPGDILVGIIAPKGETELSSEEKLLRAIFGEYARDVRDNSLRMPHGEDGVIIGVQVLDRGTGAKLNPGVLKQVKVWVARTHKISVGDKLTGYHGDKGVISKVLPVEDMPYTADGQPIDIILNPQSMLRRMNVGQMLETHVGELAKKLGISVKVPPFMEFDLAPLLNQAVEAGVEYQEKVQLFDGRTGQPFDQDVVVGQRYIFKLEHMADHKVHARSTGPYTMVTQQPLGGRAHRGGQRFGEMEVWALEAHGVPTVLHEMLTIKSDDVVGRAAAYKSIITGQAVTTPSVPESFHVFDRELAALGIKLEKIGAIEDPFAESVSIEEVVDNIGPDMGASLPDQMDSEEMATAFSEVVADENFEVESI